MQRWRRVAHETVDGNDDRLPCSDSGFRDWGNVNLTQPFWNIV